MKPIDILSDRTRSEEASSSLAEGVLKWDSWPTAAGVLKNSATLRDPVSTRIPALDAITRGGLRPGTLTAIGGPPGSGKSSLALQIGGRMAAEGASVALLAFDEGPTAAALRLGQHYGLSREALEKRDGAAMAQLEAEIAHLALRFPDPEQEHAIEAATQGLLSQPKPRVLILDSLQKIHLASEGRTRREELDRLVVELRKIAMLRELIVIFTSEANRGFYARRKEGERTSDLAGFMDSGGIEYGSDTLLMLRASDEESDIFRVSVPKNRQGTRKRFTLRLDRATALFSEVDEEVAERSRSNDSEREKRIAERCDRIIATLRKTPGLTTTQLRDVVPGRTCETGEALSRLKIEGRITPCPGKQGSIRWEVAP